MSHWIFLTVAIVLEVAGTVSLKLSDGFSRLVPSVLLFAFYAGSFVALSFALRRIEVGVAYSIWAGLGTALVAVVGIVWFREAATAIKLASIALIIAGVVGVNLGGARS